MPHVGLVAAAAAAGGAFIGAAAVQACTKPADQRRRRRQEVVDYWFHQADAAALQHRLWFCPEGSSAQRDADADIAARFGDLIEAGTTKATWCPDKADPEDLLAYIITVDQLGRHYWRAKVWGRMPALYDARALEAAEALFSLEASWHRLSVPQLVFCLLPFRHHKSDGDAEKRHHEKALELLGKIESRVAEQDGRVVQRFRSATVRRYQALKDLRPAAEGIFEREEFLPSKEVLAGKPKETLVRTTARFLLNRGPAMVGGAACVSLSGGVDSMVIADILVHLRDHPKPVERARKGQWTGSADRRVRHNKLEQQTPGLVKKVVAVHINYGNRKEADDEAAFLADWCGRRGIVYLEKRITEMKRASASRDEYEEATRDMRYDQYRLAMQTEGVTGVCLGHHAGDIIENLLSNANRGCGILDLSGMVEVTEMKGVETWRPLLPHNKEEIFRYAHTYGVPYFNDTTPSWSTRGKLRRNLLPCIEDTYGQGSAQNLHALALESDRLREMLHTHLFEPYFARCVEVMRCGVRLFVKDHRAHGRLFWKEVFKTVQHRYFNTPMLADAALREVALRLSFTNFEEGDANYAIPPQVGWLEPKGGMHWFLENPDYLFVPNPDLFGVQFSSTGLQPLAVPGHTTTRCWELSSEWYEVPPEQQGDSRCSDHRSLPVPCRLPPFGNQWDRFMTGTFDYFMAVPQGVEELSWQDCPGFSPSWCWKQMHHRFHSSLPIPCAPPITSDDIRVVKISYTYIGKAR